MNHLIAVYETVADAERVRDRLKEEKIPDRDIRLVRAPLAPAPARGLDTARDRDPRNQVLRDPLVPEANVAPERMGLRDDLRRDDPYERDDLYETDEGGWFYDWLRRSSMPEAERDAIVTHMIGSRAAVTVDIEPDEKRDRAIEIMEEGHPIDVEHDTIEAAPMARETTIRDAGLREAVRPAAATTRATAPPVAPAVPPVRPAAAAHTDRARTDRIEEGEQVIPVVKEDITVGKRVREQRYRVKTYTVDKPVEEKVMLRDERVEIEHRPLTGAAAGRAAEMPRNREIDVVERHEEPVVEKRGTQAEEVVVRKEVVERPETVHGTVRETKVDVEKEPLASETRGRRDIERDIEKEPVVGAPGIKPDRRP
jgi:hypothetical protein